MLCRVLLRTGMTLMPSSCNWKVPRGRSRPSSTVRAMLSVASALLRRQLSGPNFAAYNARTSSQAADVRTVHPCRWRIARAWQGADNQLARYSSPDLPSNVDKEDFDSILLQPGDMLYMPRGERRYVAAVWLTYWCNPSACEDLLRS